MISSDHYNFLMLMLFSDLWAIPAEHHLLSPLPTPFTFFIELVTTVYKRAEGDQLLRCCCAVALLLPGSEANPPPSFFQALRFRRTHWKHTVPEPCHGSKSLLQSQHRAPSSPTHAPDRSVSGSPALSPSLPWFSVRFTVGI